MAEFRSALAASGPIGMLVAALGLLAGILLLATELATIVSIDVMSASCDDLAGPSLQDSCVNTGGEQHSYALVLLGPLVLVMAWGASLGGSRPAAAALVAAGAAVLLIWLLVDLPDVDEVGAIGSNFEQAEANPGVGFWLELLGGVLAVAAGALALRQRG